MLSTGRPCSIPRLSDSPHLPVAFPDEQLSDLECFVANVSVSPTLPDICQTHCTVLYRALSAILCQILQAFWSGQQEVHRGGLALALSEWSNKLPASLQATADPALASQSALTIRLKHLTIRMQLYRPVLHTSINNTTSPIFPFADTNYSPEENTIQALAACSSDASTTVNILFGTCTDALWRKTGASWSVLSLCPLSCY